MPLRNYGVLKGRILEGIEERDRNSPHYQIHIMGEEGRHYRAAVNVMSVSKESEILYLAESDYDASAITYLQELPYGFTPIKESNREIALDYVRGDLITDVSKMMPMPHDVSGANNDLNDFLSGYVKAAAASDDAATTIYVFGAKFGPEKGRKDKIFHFSPELGIHDIHMNQGNPVKGSFSRDNGIWQDGGILFESNGVWTAIFMAFLTQSWQTDENGDPI